MLDILFGKMKNNKNKLFFLVILFSIFAILFTSCGKIVIPPDSPNPEENNLPQYLKDFSSAFKEKGIEIAYSPLDVKPAPPPNKPYPIYESTIPNNWIEGELQWYVGKSTDPTDFLETTIVDFKKDFILESTVDTNFKAPLSRPNAKKTIYKLYKRKNPNIVLPNKITNSDFELIKTLDKVEGQGTWPQNQLAKLSDKFVVWSASSNETTTQWTIWGYDLANDEIFQIYSYKDIEKEFRPADIPLYNIVSDKELLIIDITGTSKDKMLKNKVIFYDLVNRGIAKEIEDNIYKRQYFRKWWDPLIYSIDDYIYGEKFYLDNNKNISSPYILSDIVRLNLTTWEEETVIPKTPFRLLSSSPDGKLCLVPYVENYLCHDIWIWNVKENEMNCLEKICYSEAPPISPEISSHVPSAPPGVSLCIKGVNYTYYEERTHEECETFYSYKNKEAYYDYDSLTGFIDNEGRFLMYKSPYALFNPPPPFDYPGKEDILEGYQTYLIVKPE